MVWKISNKTKKILITFLLCFGISNHSFANLLVMPPHVELTPKNRTTEVYLVNKANKTTTYRIVFTHNKMDKDGNISAVSEEEIKKMGLDRIHKMVRYSPKQVTLKPEERQTVRFQLNLAKGVEPESAQIANDYQYRTYLSFKETIDKDDIKIDENTNKDTVGVQLIATYNINIPLSIFTSNEKYVYDLSLSDAKINKKDKKITFQLKNAKKDMSPTGNITAKATYKDGQKKQIAILNGVTLLQPLSERIVTLDVQDGVSLDGITKLEISYTSSYSHENNRVILYHTQDVQ